MGTVEFGTDPLDDSQSFRLRLPKTPLTRYNVATQLGFDSSADMSGAKPKFLLPDLKNLKGKEKQNLLIDFDKSGSEKESNPFGPPDPDKAKLRQKLEFQSSLDLDKSGSQNNNAIDPSNFAMSELSPDFGAKTRDAGVASASRQFATSHIYPQDSDILRKKSKKFSGVQFTSPIMIDPANIKLARTETNEVPLKNTEPYTVTHFIRDKKQILNKYVDPAASSPSLPTNANTTASSRSFASLDEALAK
ncbi:hypothetical protein HDU76_007589 [Blyttiomyces sp. JEL0837]|nr:hypothetical protein HDU76_007589 [Blyttiomyces sp. JEL0837]